MLKTFANFVSAGQDWYHAYRKEITLASNIKIKNKLLAMELERACQKNHGVLTYPEYSHIDQFGKNGFYATSKLHGKTDIENRWAEGLAHYCHTFGYERIIEFGCGTGDLGVATVTSYKKLTKKKLKWIGVEIDTRIHKDIYALFTSFGVQNTVEQIVSSIDEIPTYKKSLIVFPYSLDNIPPHLFLNTQSMTSYPNALVGITIKNGLLSEILMTQDVMRKKGIVLKDGFFKQNGHTYKLTSWRIRKGQRAYIPTDLFGTIDACAKKFGNTSSMIVIDEFRNEPWFFDIGSLGTPKSLYENNLTCNQRSRYYRESGKHNFYFPLYKNSIFHFLNAIGFQSIHYDIEQKKSAQLQEKRWFPMWDHYATFAFFAKDLVEKKIDILPIPFNYQRIVSR